MDNINTSLIVKWLRLPMALLVIFIYMTPHLNPHFTPVYSIDWQSLSPDNIYSIIGIFFNNLCTVAVPFFFFTAVYYFFFNTEKFDKDTYKSKIKKRIKTLLVPYVLWIIITIILRILYGLYKMYVLKLSISELPSDCLTIDEITTLSNILSFFWNYFIINENNTLNPLGLSSYLAAPINIPLWFLRDLIILTAISPLLYKGIKYLKKWGIAILLAAFILNIETLPGIHVKGLFFFVFGSYLAVNKLDILDTFKSYKWLIPLSIALLIMLVPADNMPISTSIRHIYQVTGIIAVFLLANTMIKKLKYINQFIFKHSNASFFIYVVHTIPIVVASPRGFTSLLIDKTLYISGLYKHSGGISYFLTPFVCLFVCIIMYNILKRFIPKTMEALIGGR